MYDTVQILHMFHRRAVLDMLHHNWYQFRGRNRKDDYIMTEDKLSDIAQASFVAGAAVYIGFALMEVVLTGILKYMTL